MYLLTKWLRIILHLEIQESHTVLQMIDKSNSIFIRILFKLYFQLSVIQKLDMFRKNTPFGFVRWQPGQSVIVAISVI